VRSHLEGKSSVCTVPTRATIGSVTGKDLRYHGPQAGFTCGAGEERRWLKRDLFQTAKGQLSELAESVLFEGIIGSFSDRFGGCSIGPKFPPGSEFVARMERTLDSKVPAKTRVDAIVDSPEAFKGAILQGSLLSFTDGRLLGFSSLIEPGKQTCVSGDLVAVINSAGNEDRDDAGTKLLAQQIPAGQDMTTFVQQCMPVGDPMSGQQTCSSYPITIPGAPARSFLMWSKASRVFLKTDSVIRAKLYESACASAPVAGKTSNDVLHGRVIRS